MKKQLIGILCVAALLSSCHIYKSYKRPDVATSAMYRDTLSVKDTLVSDTINMGNLPWKEVFRDPKLQILIEQGLSHNVNLQTAMLRVEESKAGLVAARLAFAPSLAGNCWQFCRGYSKNLFTSGYGKLGSGCIWWFAECQTWS